MGDEHQDTAAYLRRIGVTRPAVPDLPALRELHRRHLIAVPFENLSLHLDEEIVLEDQALLDKVVARSRGGFCYELNGAFASLLRRLGFQVDLLAARVFDGERLSVPYAHMLLRVQPVEGTAWLADVGFGRHSHYPLALEETGDQDDPGGTFRLRPAPEGDLDVLRDGQPVYRLERRARALSDFEGGSWYNRTHPDSTFVRSLVCSRLTEDGCRLTLSGRQFVTTGADGSRGETELSEGQLLETYRERFGLRLDRAPREPGRRADASGA
ncbi:arylamine N-acetyltransferase family protein [Streptomyces oceani]|uniref:Acetyltransferase n=1 Tax=Streptomyces oceani TaxID=1075402 RepID=A0A1E7KJK7_9ACTN|nr:arylamine N-acetyltransferase [Streptomyces oceani]OEV04073.1 acetyltransferase [Streptomyces oceani]